LEDARAFGDGLPDALVSLTDGVVTLERIADRQRGVLWFAAGSFDGNVLLLPRVVALPDADERLRLSAASRAMLCPRPLTGPDDLIYGRGSMIGRRSNPRAVFTVPVAALVKKARGEPDRGRQHEVDRDPGEWIVEAIRYDLALDAPSSAHDPRRADARAVTVSEAKRVQRGVREVRQRLWNHGVYPWVAFAGGVVPRGRRAPWWQRDEADATLAQWAAQADAIREEWRALGVDEALRRHRRDLSDHLTSALASADPTEPLR